VGEVSLTVATPGVNADLRGAFSLMWRARFVPSRSDALRRPVDFCTIARPGEWRPTRELGRLGAVVTPVPLDLASIASAASTSIYSTV